MGERKMYLFEMSGAFDDAARAVLSQHDVQIDESYEPRMRGDSTLVRGWADSSTFPALRAAGVNAFSDPPIGPTTI